MHTIFLIIIINIIIIIIIIIILFFFSRIRGCMFYLPIIGLPYLLSTFGTFLLVRCFRGHNSTH